MPMPPAPGAPASGGPIVPAGPLVDPTASPSRAGPCQEAPTRAPRAASDPSDALEEPCKGRTLVSRPWVSPPAPSALQLMGTRLAASSSDSRALAPKKEAIMLPPPPPQQRERAVQGPFKSRQAMLGHQSALPAQRDLAPKPSGWGWENALPQRSAQGGGGGGGTSWQQGSGLATPPRLRHPPSTRPSRRRHWRAELPTAPPGPASPVRRLPAWPAAHLSELRGAAAGAVRLRRPLPASVDASRGVGAAAAPSPRASAGGAAWEGASRRLPITSPAAASRRRGAPPGCAPRRIRPSYGALRRSLMVSISPGQPPELSAGASRARAGTSRGPLHAGTCSSRAPGTAGGRRAGDTCGLGVPCARAAGLRPRPPLAPCLPARPPALGRGRPAALRLFPRRRGSPATRSEGGCGCGCAAAAAAARAEERRRRQAATPGSRSAPGRGVRRSRQGPCKSSAASGAGGSETSSLSQRGPLAVFRGLPRPADDCSAPKAAKCCPPPSRRVGKEGGLRRNPGEKRGFMQITTMCVRVRCGGGSPCESHDSEQTWGLAGLPDAGAQPFEPPHSQEDPTAPPPCGAAPDKPSLETLGSAGRKLVPNRSVPSARFVCGQCGCSPPPPT